MKLTPEPVVISQKCSVCDQPWELHGDSPTVETCVRLLKAALAVAEASKYTPPTILPYPVPSTPVYPSRPIWWSDTRPTITVSGTTTTTAA